MKRILLTMDNNKENPRYKIGDTVLISEKDPNIGKKGYKSTGDWISQAVICDAYFSTSDKEWRYFFDGCDWNKLNIIKKL